MTGIWIIAFALQWVLLLLLAILTVGVLRYLSFVQNNIHLVTRYASRFEEGDRISHFELPNLEGLPVVSKKMLEASQRTVLLFLSPSCSGCSAVIRYLTDRVKRKEDLRRLGWSVVAIYTGPYVSREAVKKHIAPSLLDEIPVLIDEEGILFRQYDIRAFPVGIAVDALGNVIDQSSSSILSWLDQLFHKSEFSQKARQPISLGHRR